MCVHADRLAASTAASLAPSGLVRPGLASSGLVRLGLASSGLVWFGVVWCLSFSAGAPRPFFFSAAMRNLGPVQPAILLHHVRYRAAGVPSQC